MRHTINLYQWKSAGTHWIALYANVDDLTYFDSFRAELIPWNSMK